MKQGDSYPLDPPHPFVSAFRTVRLQRSFPSVLITTVEPFQNDRMPRPPSRSFVTTAICRELRLEIVPRFSELGRAKWGVPETEKSLRGLVLTVVSSPHGCHNPYEARPGCAAVVRPCAALLPLSRAFR